jgi:hypothetical protein
VQIVGEQIAHAQKAATFRRDVGKDSAAKWRSFRTVPTTVSMPQD